MVSVQEATSVVLSNLYLPQTVTIDITDAVGRVLAEPILADRDFPPFNRVTMDGIAIFFETWQKGKRNFIITSVHAAGDANKALINPDQCIEVMTGAVLPDGTDTVIRYEDLNVKNSIATILTDDVSKGQSIHHQGVDAKRNDKLLSAGQKLSPAEIALLASVGKSKVKVFTFPRTAIVGSGDELISIEKIPEAHQIRQSNTYAVQAAMKTLGWEGSRYHFLDEKESLEKSLKEIADQYDVIIISGGVSKGKFDFIPEVLEAIGVQKLFHQVSQRPGKPFWFGVSEKNKIVFALPGNPVSTYICFFRYIQPWLWRSLGVVDELQTAILAKDFSFQPKLTYFLQVSVKNEGGKLMAYPDAGGGSGDFANLKDVDGFLEIPMERNEFKAGESFPFIPFRL
jgi:molybdopterin molybdotransferase